MTRIIDSLEPAMSHQEIGDILGMHRKNVETTERRAKAKIKKILTDKFGGHVTIEDLMPYLKEETLEYEMPKL